MIKKIVFGFLINLLLLIVLGYVSLNKLNELSDLNNKLYEHPYAVSNATKIIQVNIVSMHRYMKDVANAENMEEINKAKQQVDENQKIVFEQFAIIFKQYLGDKNDIQTVYDDFVNWEPIRNEVIALIKNNKSKEAFSITKGKGAEYIANLELEINKLVLFANNKANYFHKETLKSEADAKKYIIMLILIILLIGLSIFSLLVKNILIKDKKIEEYFHLIDENIMHVIVDSKFKITEASSALSKYMKLSKEELLETEDYFLLSECTKEERFRIQNLMQGRKPWSGEIKKTVNGQIKWIKSSLHPIVSDKGKYTNILHDITSEKKFEILSKTDALTNLYNRGFFNDIFPDMINISKRNKNILCFSMIDIDFFKQYNDTYGHQKGDEVLIKVANTLKEHVHRPDDYTFRLGGEEFAVLFNVKEEQDALDFMGKLLKEIENLHIEHSNSQTSSFLTISMGMKFIKSDDNYSIDDLYKKTDDLLYKAKENGRNNIQV